MTNLRIGFVIPRYGSEIIGGAENATRLLAEALVRHQGYKVDILTTTAIEIEAWNNHFPPGDCELNGVRVHRYKVEGQRLPNFYQATKRALNAPKSMSLAESLEVIRLQGPVSPKLNDAIATYDGDLIAFYTYLYHPIVTGVTLTSLPKIFHPTAHNEPMLDLPIFKEVFNSIDALVYHTPSERQIVEDRFAVAQKPAMILGMGYENASQNRDDRSLLPSSIINSKYLLCLGRVDTQKGATLLADLFKEYKTRNPSDLKLVFAGPISILPNPHPDIEVLGSVDEPTKHTLLANMELLISPSPFESFSIVLIEAWAHQKAVMVNRSCGPTTNQARASGGGLSFDSYENFEATLSLLLTNTPLRNQLANNGTQYVAKKYQWPNLTARYNEFLTSVRKGKSALDSSLPNN